MKRDIILSSVETPANEDINSLSQTYQDNQVFTDLLKNRIFFSSSEKGETNPTDLSTEASSEVKTSTEIKKSMNQSKEPVVAPIPSLEGLNITNPHNIKYITDTATYSIKGGIRKDLDSLKVTLVIEHPEQKTKSRNKLDLYEDKQTEKIARESAEKLGLRADLIEQDLSILTDLLDQYRDSHTKEQDKETVKEEALSQSEKQEYIRFGKEPNLIKRINTLIGKSGVVGEAKSRLFLFAGAVSHLMKHPLNIVVQGSSGSGKSYLIKKISHLVPQAKVKRYTRLSEKSFYNFGEYDLVNTLIIIEDYDGMNEEVEYAFRELQSNGELISGVSAKEFENADIQTKDKKVRGPIASMVATTQGEIYHDNSTRVFFIAVDESPQQTQSIIDYKNQKANQEIMDKEEEQAKNYLQGFVKTLKSYEVKNPYLRHIKLPVPHDQLRRLHELLEYFCQQITLIHQHQRKITKDHSLITAKADMAIAIDLMFDSIVLKVDELDGSLREFYEKLKQYVLSKGKEYCFIQREVRHELKISKTQLFRYMHQLEILEYLQKRGIGSHGATSYKIIYWDDNEALRARIKRDLSRQLGNL